MTEEQNLKQFAQDHFEAGDCEGGCDALKRQLNQDFSLATAQWALRYEEPLSRTILTDDLNLVCLRSFTVEPLIPLIKAGGIMCDVSIDIRVGEYNTYSQDILDKESLVYAKDVDAVYMAILTRDLCPGLWSGWLRFQDAEGREELERAIGLLGLLLNTLRERSRVPVILQGFERIPFTPRASSYVKDNNLAIAELNSEVRRICSGLGSIYVTDYDGLVSYYGYHEWFDEKMWRQAKQNVSARYLPTFANAILSYLIPLAKAPAKVIVTDLDNTMWRGVIGEDGLSGIKISDKGKTGGHLKYQQALWHLKNEGVVLAISSKNNAEDALLGINEHPDMLLREKDFVSIKANWKSKVDSILEIADELNVGLSSIVFVDDNPVERASVRRALPELTVINLPESPQKYASALLGCHRLSRLSLTSEDQMKTEMYVAERERRAALNESGGDISDFLADLGMRLSILPVSEMTLERAAQLTQKTNQFNVTTFRYQDAEIESMIQDTDQYRTFIAKASDRFGDHGWISLALVKMQADRSASLDTFLMSCRVLGRGIETAMLAEICRQLAGVGYTELEGSILPTKKNEPARDLFKKHGFQETKAPISEDQRLMVEGATYWRLKLSSNEVPTMPAWIALQQNEDRTE